MNEDERLACVKELKKLRTRQGMRPGLAARSCPVLIESLKIQPEQMHSRIVTTLGSMNASRDVKALINAYGFDLVDPGLTLEERRIQFAADLDGQSPETVETWENRAIEELLHSLLSKNEIYEPTFPLVADFVEIRDILVNIEIRDRSLAGISTNHRFRHKQTGATYTIIKEDEESFDDLSDAPDDTQVIMHHPAGQPVELFVVSLSTTKYQTKNLSLYRYPDLDSLNRNVGVVLEEDALLEKFDFEFGGEVDRRYFYSKFDEEQDPDGEDGEPVEDENDFWSSSNLTDHAPVPGSYYRVVWEW